MKMNEFMPVKEFLPWRRLTAILCGAGFIWMGLSSSAMAQKMKFDVRKPHVNASGGGADIVVFDIVDAAAWETRSTGGDGGGGDILVFDILGVTETTRPAGGGGADILVFDIVDAAATASHFTTTDDLARPVLYLLAESAFPGVYEIALDLGDDLMLGVLVVDQEVRADDDGSAYAHALLMLDEERDATETNSSTIATHGYIRIKKLNSGG